MSALSELHAKAEEFKAKLTADASHLVDEFEALLHTLLGQGELDGEQLATQTETAAKPVEQAAEQDATNLAKTAELVEGAVLSNPLPTGSVFGAKVDTIESAPAATTTPTDGSKSAASA